jgi:hypothetical protein
MDGIARIIDFVRWKSAAKTDGLKRNYFGAPPTDDIWLCFC